MKVLIIGGGGREHALAWKIAQSDDVTEIFCAPGNAGTEAVATNVAISADDIDSLLKFAKEKNIDLTVVGPEAPLAEGIVDVFSEAGLLTFGPSKNAARLEGSKAFMKDILIKAGVPTARYEVHTNKEKAISALDRFDESVVIKADGLAAGKGVIVATSKDEAKAAITSMLDDKKFGEAGATVVIEETLVGEEASILAFCDGQRVLMMPASQDHKRIGEKDTGPNTGGMGAYSPAPVVTDEIADWIEKEVMQKTVDTMKAEGAPYSGVLYAGLMITDDGPKVLEFNCRFGDPECQPIMARMKSDIVPVLKACAKGDLSGVTIDWSDSAAVCVVMAAAGYPGPYEKGKLIEGIADADAIKNVNVFHAGTTRDEEGVKTAGGRVLGVTATAPTVKTAIMEAYEGVYKIKWEGAYYRYDIGKKALNR